MSCGQQIIAEHDTVMLIGNDGKQFFVTIPASNEQQQENPSKNNNNKNLYCFKMKKNIFINFEALKGNQFNTFYELDMQNKKLVGPLSEIPDANILELEKEEEEEENANNQNLVDDNKSQKLTADEIKKMKEKGNGDEIVKKLIENSSTFEQKTVYSKEKYVKRKKQKYCKYVRAINPTSQYICEYYFDKRAEHIGYMRFDALAELLTLGNIYSNSQVLLFETCGGLVTAAILERFGFKYGRILRGCEPKNAQNNYNCVKLLNRLEKNVRNPSFKRFSDTDVVVNFPLNLLTNEGSTNEQSENQKQSKDIPMGENLSDLATIQSPSKEDQQQEAMTKIKSTFFDLKNPDVKLSDSLVIATNEYDASVIFKQLYPYLLPSGNFVIYSPYRSALDNIFMELKKTKSAVAVMLSETWTRPYQILPNRCHPEMQMSSASGYLLSGIKVTI